MIQDLRFTGPHGSCARPPSGRSHARHYSSSDPFPCSAPGAKLRSSAEPDLIDIIVRYIARGPGRISYHQSGGRYLVDDRRGRALETKAHILFCIGHFTPSGRMYVSTKAPAANVCTITFEVAAGKQNRLLAVTPGKYRFVDWVSIGSAGDSDCKCKLPHTALLSPRSFS